MSYLTLLLVTKISITALLVALPFLFAPLPKLEVTAGVSAKSALFFRLYGVAIAALLVGYSFGIPAAESGQFPWGVVYMGLISNAGAAFLLLRLSTKGSMGFWLGAFFAAIAIALAFSLIAPERVLAKAW